MKEEIIETDNVVVSVKINVERIRKFSIRRKIMQEYPFGKSIYKKIGTEFHFKIYHVNGKYNTEGIDQRFYNNLLSIDSGMNLFYNLLFNGFTIKKFEQIKTKKEKEFKKKYDLITYEDEDNKIKAGIALAKIITKRFFKNNPHLVEREEIIASFFSKYINERTKIIELRNDVEVHFELFGEINSEREILINKLKRNFLKDEGLELYKEIIVEIAKDEMIGHKPNIQRICNDIAVKKNLRTDLRKAFDQWSKRNKDMYKILLGKEKVEKKIALQ